MQLRQLMPLIFLAILVPGISALASCTDIQLNTSTVRLAKNTEEQEYFVIENRSFERFFIDSTEVIDNIDGVIASENGFDRVIEAGNHGAVGVKVKAFHDSAPGHSSATIRVKGHFLSGKQCNLQEIRQDFGIMVVDVKETRPTHYRFSYPSVSYPILRSCRGIIVTNPAEFFLEGEGMFLRITNDTNFRIAVRIFGEGLIVNPHTISVPDHSDIREIIVIHSNRPETIMFFKVESPTCNGLEITRVINQGAVANIYKGYGETKDVKKVAVPVTVTDTNKTNTPQQPKDENANVFVISTALAGLGSNPAMLGLIILAILVILWLFAEGRRRARLDREHRLVFLKENAS